MSETHSLPLYIQISEMLIRDIHAGRLVDGARLPPERDMAESLDISVGTLRKALADLTAKGLLERVQGSGNYVRHGSGKTSVYAFFRLELIQGGGLPTAQVLSVVTLPKPADLPSFGTSDIGHRIRRLRSIGGVLSAVEEIWLDGAYAPGLVAADLSESLYYFYGRSLGLRIQRAEDRIGVQPAPDWGLGLLLEANESALGFIERFSWDQNNQTAEYSRTWFDNNKVCYVSRLK